MLHATLRVDSTCGFARCLRAAALAVPTKRAFTFLGDGGERSASLTYAELDSQARAIGALLQLVADGGRVLLLIPPGLDLVAAFFGCLYAGAVAVPVCPPSSSRTLPRLQTLLEDARPVVALTTESLLRRLEGNFRATPGLDGIRWLTVEGIDAGLAEGWRPPAIDTDTLAFLQYTSGTTSVPKGVMVSHGNLLYNEQLIQQACNHGPDSIFVSWLPLYHDLGLIGNVLQSVYVQASCVLMAPVAFLQRPLRWLQAVSEYRATTSGGPNFSYSLCVRRIPPQERESLDLSSWQVAFNGAEPVRRETLERFAEAFAPCGMSRSALYPCYGLAEATLMVSGSRPSCGAVYGSFAAPALERNEVVTVPDGGPKARSLVSSGRPLEGLTVAIVDPETGAPCPAGRVGEIWVAGPSVARGYWNRPKATLQVFGSLLPGVGEGLFLRTGDLGFLHDDELFISGRLKDLIIVRGRNLYPQDIELTAERAHPVLRTGYGAAFSIDAAGEERLVIVHEVERQSLKGLDVEAVAAAIRAAVSREHETQVYAVALLRPATLPKTTSGKVQRQACRAAFLGQELDAVAVSCLDAAAGRPGNAAAAQSAGDPRQQVLLGLALEARRTVIELHLRQILPRLLRLSSQRLQADRSLAEMGLDSLAAVELKTEIEDWCGAALSSTDLLAGPSLQQLVEAILSSVERPSAGAEALPPAKPVHGDHPLSYGQRALWLTDRLAPASAAYNIAVAAAVHRPVEAARLARSFQALVDRHPSLRTTFHRSAGGPLQRVHERMKLAVEHVDANGWTARDLEERLGQEARRPFDLERGPLLRVVLFDRDADLLLLLVVHHLVADLWSLTVLFQELGEVYRQGGQAIGLPPLPLTYTDYVRWQERRLAGESGERQWAYWRERLAGPLPTLDLPTDRRRPAVQTYSGATVELRLDGALVERVRSTGRASRATLYVALLAAYQALLHRYSDQDDLLVGSPVSGRGTPRLASVVGYFVNPLVLRARLTGDPAFTDFLAGTRDAVLAAFEHQDYPFTLLTERLQPARDPSRSPLFQVMFLMQQTPLAVELELGAFALGEAGSRVDLGGLTLESVPLRESRSPMDLLLRVAELRGGLGLSLQYNTDLFERTTMARLLRHYETLLEAVAADLALRISELPLLTPPERQALLREWNDSGTLSPQSGLIHELFAAWATRTPEVTAVSCQGATLTYRELADRAHHLARHLRRLGVGPDVQVGLYLDRSVEMLVGIFGVLLAGGAYVPLDPSYPRERVAFMVEDSRTPVLVTREAWRAALPAGPALIVLEQLTADARGGPPVAPSARPDHLAYIIYTSGSTGRPKGVQIRHRSLMNLLWHMGRDPGLAAGQVMASVTSPSFDLSVPDLFLPFLVGGTLHWIDRDTAADGVRLAALLESTRAALLQATPATWRLLLDAGWRPGEMRAVSGGEALPQELAERLCAGGAPLWNFYGPTETTVWAAMWKVEPAEPPSIGRPMANVSVHLLRGGAPVAVGMVGEIYIGGYGLARGYWGRPDITAERFLPDPFSEEPGARLYRTGDLALRLPDGRIAFLGRADHQVKVRGFRIELGEIETRLASHPEVAAAVVALRTDTGEGRLVGYYVARPGRDPSQADLHDHLRKALPGYMVPAVLMRLNALPQSTNGKVDRGLLPDPERSGVLAEAPRTPVEEKLADLWREALGVAVGIHDDFFAAGGHSILASRLLYRVRETLGVEIPLSRLFEQPTVAALAAEVEVAWRAGPSASLAGLPAIVPDPAGRHLPFPLTELQQAYWIGRNAALEMGNVSAHVYAEMEILGLDPARLAAAWRRLIDRHDMLRAVILPEGGQRVLPEVPPYEIELLDLSGENAMAAGTALERIRQRMSHQVLPADRWPLFEVRATRLGPDRGRIHFSLDLLIADAWSLRLLARELALLYRDPGAELPPLALSFRDCVLAEAGRRQSARYQADLAYWQARLEDMPPAPALPLARSPATIRQPRFVRRSCHLEPAAWSALQARAQRAGITPSGALLAAFAEVLAVWSASPRFTINLTLFNRLPLHPDIDRVVGDLTSVVLLAVDGSGRDPFAVRVRRLQQQLWNDLDHRQVGGVQVMRQLARVHGAQAAAMPVVFTSMLGQDWEEKKGARLGETVYAISQTPQVWLDHQVFEEGDALVVCWDAVEELFPEGLLDDLFGAFRSLLGQLAGSEERWQSPPGGLLPAWQQRLIAAANATDAPAPLGLLHQPFLARARQHPDRLAVISPARRLTYGELQRAARNLARQLRQAGARPNRLVAIVMDKSWEQAVAALGVLDAGAAYMPVSAALPAERLRHLLERGEVEVAVTQPWVEPRIDWPQGIARIVVDPSLGADAPAGDTGWQPVQDPGDLAYVIFTSGSTGQPKGVMIDHRGALNTVADVNQRFAIGPEDRVLALSSLDFDLSVYDLFGLLAAGGAVVVPEPAAARDPERWLALLAEERVTIWNSVPALIEMLAEYLEGRPERPPIHLRLAMMSGDWIPVSLPERLRQLVAGLQVISLGGATEASIWSILYPIGDVPPHWTSIPYGKAMRNQRFYVLDAELEPRPVGVPGALYIGGVGLARGYWRDEPRTRASFFPHPRTGEPLYRTGDLGRLLPDGDIEFLGREDFQVKVQGHRIELGEIEATLVRHPALRAAAVTVLGDRGGNRRLAGYVVPREAGAAPPAEELRRFLLDKLPEYMVPALFLALDALPLSATGKVDRKALPQPPQTVERDRPAARPEEETASAPTSARIARMIADELGLAEIDPDADLINLGFNSIDMIRIANVLERELSFRPRLEEFYLRPTVAGLAAACAAHRSRETTSAPPIAARGGGRWAFPARSLDAAERQRFKDGRPGVRRDLAGSPVLAFTAGREEAAARQGGRRTYRRFSPQPASAAQIGGLLACLAEGSLAGSPKYLYPSAGGLYPVQAYLHVRPGRVTGIAPGFHYYEPLAHRLIALTPGLDLDISIHSTLINRAIFEQSAFAVFLIVEAAAIAPLYGPLARDFCLLEAGAMLQLLMTEAPGHGLGLCPAGEVDLDRFFPALGLSPSHELVHSLMGGGIDGEGDGARWSPLPGELLARELVRHDGIPPLLVPVPRRQDLPLSFAQQRVWFLDRLEPGNPSYNMPEVLRISGRLDVAAAERSLTEIVRRHEVTRTHFREADQGPIQIIDSPAPFPLPEVDLRSLPAGERERESNRLIREEAWRPFDLTGDPLLRGFVVRWADEESLLLLTMHHIASDVWSMGILFEDFAALYEACLAGRPARLPALPVQYADFAHWQRRSLRQEVLDTQLAYWRERLAGALPALALPFRKPLPQAPGHRGVVHGFVLPSSAADALAQVGRGQGATLFVTLLAALDVFLHCSTWQDDFVIGTPITSRSQAEVERLIGFFVDTLVIRTSLSGGPTFRQAVDRVREAVMGASAHRDVPFEKLVEILRPERDLARSPLYQVWFVLQNTPSPALVLPGLTLARVGEREQLARHNLKVEALPEADGIRFELCFKADLFEAAVMRQMAGDFEAVLRHVAEHPDEPLNEVAAALAEVRQRSLSLVSGAFQDSRRRKLESLRQRLAGPGSDIAGSGGEPC